MSEGSDDCQGGGEEGAAHPPQAPPQRQHRWPSSSRIGKQTLPVTSPDHHITINSQVFRTVQRHEAEAAHNTIFCSGERGTPRPGRAEGREGTERQEEITADQAEGEGRR